MIDRFNSSTGLEPTNTSLDCRLMVLFDRQGISANELETDLYFYHTDHTSTAHSTGLGSSSWITVRQAHCNADATGSAYQHIQSLPFGEQFIEQLQSSWDAMYKFTGKERDMETGWDYFGARYYDSDLSIWLSVDPMAFMRPGLSPYNYCQLNPLIFVDPTGELDGEIKVDLKTGKRTKMSTKGDEDGIDIIYYGHEAKNGAFITERQEVVDRQKWYDNTVIKREQWGALLTNGSDYTTVSNPREFYNYSAIHHSGNDNSPTVNEVQKKHLDKGDYDIDYHFAIDLDGNIYEGRSLNVRGAGAGPADLRAGMIHIVVLGDMQNEGFWEWSNDKLTPEALNSLILLNQYLVMKYDIEYTGGHQEVRCNHTVCPGNQIMEFMDYINQQSATVRPNCVYTDPDH